MDGSFRNLEYKMSLSDVNLTAVNDTVSNVSFLINRKGDRSSYGNLQVDRVQDTLSPFFSAK